CQKWPDLRRSRPQPAAFLHLCYHSTHRMGRAHYRMTLYSAPCRSRRPRALMNRNSNPAAPRIVFTEHGRHDPEPADGNSPLRQVLAAPGGDAGPLACGAGELECPGGVPGWAKYG